MHDPVPGQERLRIDFGPHPAGLRVHVRGACTLENTVAYWHAIAARMRGRESKGILLVDELHGPALGREDWQALVAGMAGLGLERHRIAHVKPNGLQEVEYCELFAKEVGFDAHVFTDEGSASIWLRYGERRHSGPRADPPADA